MAANIGGGASPGGVTRAALRLVGAAARACCWSASSRCGCTIGTSAALFLAQRGVSTVLCEKGHIAGEQSSRNWGWCRKMVRDPRELPLIIESLRLWQGMNQLVEAETGFRSCGIMYLAESAQELARLEAWLEHARLCQLDSRLV